jgi:hypothetical protein
MLTSSAGIWFCNHCLLCGLWIPPSSPSTVVIQAMSKHCAHIVPLLACSFASMYQMPNSQPFLTHPVLPAVCCMHPQLPSAHGHVRDRVPVERCCW